MFKIKYLPSVSVDAPSLVPSNITFEPMRGSPVALSMTRPVIFPVVPPKAVENPKMVIKKNVLRILDNLHLPKK